MKRLCRFPWWRILTVLAAVTTGGCGGVRYPNNYLLDLQPTKPSPVSSVDPLGPLTIREFRCPDYLCDGRIVYRPTPHEVGYYEYHRWAASPRRMITESLARDVRATGLFTSVTLREANTQAAYVLTGDLERFEEVDHGGDVYAVCVLSAQLTDARTMQIIWDDSQTARVSVAARNVAGVVDSLSAATRAAIDALVGSLEKRLESMPSGH